MIPFQVAAGTPRKRRLTEKALGNHFQVAKKAKKPVSTHSSAPAKFSSNGAIVPAPKPLSSFTAAVRKKDFASFLEDLSLRRIIPIFAEYGFTTERDVRMLKNLTPETRRLLFEWFMMDKRVKPKELAILHEKIIAKA
jgi:hypothetical protein